MVVYTLSRDNNSACNDVANIPALSTLTNIPALSTLTNIPALSTLTNIPALSTLAGISTLLFQTYSLILAHFNQYSTFYPYGLYAWEL
ncbi:hypothetical protein BB561_006070 [Smittium simulii]|uniref:Uncharacterized protein n=1 Tax=Smittium simulii TaxID=133385 RepID=A0A2T9Y6Q4_9FUNG|nr:hypothetical protein BB561_006070 [Smittium simulii]